MNLHAPNGDGYFPILSLHRDDVAEALAYDDASDDPSDEERAFAAGLDDATMEYLAKKLGDDLMNGGDYYEALAERAYDLGFVRP